MPWGFVMMLIGVAIGVVGKKLLDEDIITVVGVLISLAGMFLVCYPYLPHQQKSDESVPSSQPQVLSPQPTEYLPAGNSNDYVPSITERTTSSWRIHPRKSRAKKRFRHLRGICKRPGAREWELIERLVFRQRFQAHAPHDFVEVVPGDPPTWIAGLLSSSGSACQTLRVSPASYRLARIPRNRKDGRLDFPSANESKREAACSTKYAG